MKKIPYVFAICFVLALALTGCRTADGAIQNAERDRDSKAALAAPDLQPDESETNGVSNANTVEIKEKLFIAQLNDIYLNTEDYLDKIIKYEGMFTKYTWEEVGMTYYSVYRNSPGCCGADGQAGFEVIWPDGKENAYPEDNAWCEVIGTLEQYVEDGNEFLRIKLSSLTVLQKRGAEFVSQ